MLSEESNQGSPQILNQPNTVSNAHKSPDCIFSPGFRSAAAMAGWDEEALLFATLVVDDTPDRTIKQKQLVKTLSTNSTRKHKTQRRSSVEMEIPILNLDEIETSTDDTEKKEVGQGADKQCHNSTPPCMDRLREELTCSICLEICFEPSSTPCGHSFCKKCLRSAADKCGKKCPKCRQLISNGRSCTVNTVLWNTIQLLFPQEVEARKATFQKVEHQSSVSVLTRHNNNNRRGSGDDQQRRRRRTWSQEDEDAGMARRLQRQDFMEAFRGGSSGSRDQRRRRRMN